MREKKPELVIDKELLVNLISLARERFDFMAAEFPDLHSTKSEMLRELEEMEREESDDQEG